MRLIEDDMLGPDIGEPSTATGPSALAGDYLRALIEGPETVEPPRAGCPRDGYLGDAPL